MQVDFRTHETLVVVFGMAGLLEQELARLALGISPSQLITGSFVTLVLAGVVPPAVRVLRRENGE